MKYSARHITGFTLIEMVTVMVILGVMAVGVSGFLQFGTKIFVESSDRDLMVANARFAIERLNRDVRNALPNTVTINNNGCLIFMPIVASTLYIDLPVPPEGGEDSIDILPTNNGNVANASHVVVYPLSVDDLTIGSGKIHEIDSVDVNVAPAPWQVNFTNNGVTFVSDSPSSRIYFINNADTVSYCVVGDQLQRNNIPILDNLVNANVFAITAASLQRNAIVSVDLALELASQSAQVSNESVIFNHEIHIPNVP